MTMKMILMVSVVWSVHTCTHMYTTCILTDEGNWRNDYPDESNSDENSSCDGDVLHYRSAEAYLGQH